MRFLLTGGGTGGHITPLLAVAHELKRSQPDCYIIYVGERNGKYSSMLDGNADIDEVRTIFAGKFRRYHGESLIRRITDVRTILLNLRDLIYFVIGTVQSLILVPRLRADVAFLKGGFVGVPIGVSCALWRCKFITHDSDALPGLANRLVGRWASMHATAMPASQYKYPPQKTLQVGVLVGSNYELVNSDLKQHYRQQLGIPSEARLLMITGGSNGAQVINEAISNTVAKKLSEDDQLYIIHQVGKGKQGVYNGFTHPRLQIYELLKDMYVYSGAADIIVTRAGANTLAEFGVQQKPCVVIPNPLLTGGHQLVNAEFLREAEAAEVIDEKLLRKEQGTVLWHTIEELFSDRSRADKIAKKLHDLTIKDASSNIAKLLISAAKNRRGNE